MHADGHRDSMKESAKGRFFEKKIWEVSYEDYKSNVNAKSCKNIIP